MDDPIDQDEDAIRALITETYAALSSGDAGTARFFAHPDIAIAGSGQGELVVGPEMAARMAEGVTRLRYRWTSDEVMVWVRGAFAWAQILGHVTVTSHGSTEVVPYWTTGVFGRDGDEWTWRYWGGSEPQASPRV
jgi:ketosteroid isomerase-like protein